MLKKKQENLNEIEKNIENNEDDEDMKKMITEKYKNEYYKKIDDLNSSLNKKLQEKKLQLDELKEKTEKEKKEKEKKEKEKKEKDINLHNSFSIFNDSNIPNDDVDNVKDDKYLEKTEIKIQVPTNKETSKNMIASEQKKIVKNLFYSYKCDYSNNVNLSAYIYVGTDSAKIDLVLINDGTLDWPNNCKLIFEKNSKVKGNEIKLKSQKKDEKQKYEVIFNNLKDLDEGEYKSYLRFYRDGDFMGEKLTLTIKVKKKEDPDEEMNNNMDKINEFRETFNLSENDFSNRQLFEALKSNDFDPEQAFISIVN